MAAIAEHLSRPVTRPESARPKPAVSPDLRAFSYVRLAGYCGIAFCLAALTVAAIDALNVKVDRAAAPFDR